ncbi:hypothetical protein Hanom_Chr06g00521901 [Helianthus anomalus]
MGFTYPFPPLVEEFFNITQLVYSQIMPFVWKMLYALHKINQTYSLDVTMSEIPNVYELRTHGTCRFTLRIKLDQYPLLLKNQA